MRHEVLDACPICSSSSRSVLHAALRDDTFRAVDGTWTMWRCRGCEAAYLDPRPVPADIVQAYRNYYTHSTPPSEQRVSWRRRIRRWMERGYLHARYGADGSPWWWVASRLYAALRPYQRMTDVHFRHLPHGPHGRRLLDVGCGNGDFLSRARACGWHVEGVDFDPSAVSEATRRGLQARVGGLDVYEGQSAQFDVLTLSHVIEHVHDPIALLRGCQRLLKPGGVLWIATPNVDSLVHERFGVSWRGLEAPRHLVLFNERVLRDALQRAGFSTVRRLPSQWVEHVLAMVVASQALEEGRLPGEVPARRPLLLRGTALWAALRGGVRATRREFLYLEATK